MDVSASVTMFILDGLNSVSSADDNIHYGVKPSRNLWDSPPVAAFLGCVKLYAAIPYNSVQSGSALISATRINKMWFGFLVFISLFVWLGMTCLF